MPPRHTTDDPGVGQPEHASDDLPRLLNAISSLTDKVNELQLDLESQKQMNNKFNAAPANHHILNPVQRRFWEDPLALHFSLNPKHTILRFDGRNFSMWLENFVTTITFVFKINLISIDNFLATLVNNDTSSVQIVILQTIDDSTKNLLSKQNPSPASLLLALKLCCDRSSRLDKLDTVRNLLASIKDTGPRNTAEWLNLHHSIFANLVKWDVLLNEFYGLLVQANVRLPDSVNHNIFEVLMHQQLNNQGSNLTFDNVSEAIQSAEATSSVVVPVAVVDHNASISAIAYTPPTREYQQPISNHNPLFQAPQPAGGGPSNHVVKRAANFRGRGQSKSLIDRYGLACLYCRKGQHWYADCETFWADVDSGKIKPPSNIWRLPCFLAGAKGKQVYNISAEGVADGCLIDSAADIHVSGDNPNFTLETVLTKPPILRLASSGTFTHLMGTSSLRIPTPSGIMVIRNVYYCKDIRSTIICLGRLIEEGYRPIFNSTSLSLVSPTDVLFTTSYVNRCWYLDKLSMQVNAISKIPLPGARVWHKRLGHASANVVKLFLKRFVPNANANNWQEFFCKSCAFSKSTKQGNAPTNNIKISEPLNLLVSDVIGPFDKDPEGNRFILTLRDHASTYTFTAALKSRADVPEKIIFWVKFRFNLLRRYPARFRSNNAGEYSGKLVKELSALGIEWIPTEPYRPDQNGEAERLNRTIGDMARAMLHSSKLPATLWSFAYSCATHVHNCLPNKRVAPLTPMERIFNIQPNPDQLFPFGVRAIVHVPQEKRTKLGARATECVLLAYPKSGKGWTFLNVPSSRIFTSTSAVFPDYQHLPVATNTKKGDVAFILNHLRLGEVPTDVVHREKDAAINGLPLVANADTPDTIRQALKSNHSAHWRAAAEAELKQFEERGVWEAVSPTASMKVLGAKWVFVVKRTADIDCSNVYAPTASLNSLQLHLALKVKFDLHMAGFNVNAAYLYSPIEEDVFVQAPVELQPDLTGKVMKLKKALYGTKQAARFWWQYSRGVMESLGFHGNEIKPSIYLFKRHSAFVIVWIHVDDGIVLSNSADALNSFKTRLKTKLKLNWLDHVDKIVGLNISMKTAQLEISQPLLIKQLLDDYHRPIRDQFTTLPDSPIFTNEGKSIDQTSYQSVLGSLMYLSLGSRPDITYAVNLLARFSSNPGQQHWEGLDHLIGYLHRHQHQPLIYDKKDQGISLWTDANRGGEHKRSTSGFMVKAFGNLIAWGSKRQHVHPTEDNLSKKRTNVIIVEKEEYPITYPLNSIKPGSGKLFSSSTTMNKPDPTTSDDMEMDLLLKADKQAEIFH
ncbi:hypothetical protein O181_032806 [Austropuccinia psidii MF-1]|uniref:Integrase catalytic domain-containing protein n=1 Tax=Austropuccinia psidii MF-1 TaxID=1389203 RepID=A0A9Q3H6H2_9BASI|nr:hypothetical protein [Austropuccinia psidii MF-1]